MATALQCPDCGRDQPLDQVSGTTFRCRRCGRLLAAPRPPAAVVADEDLAEDLDEDDGDHTLAITAVAPETAAPPLPAQLPPLLRTAIWVVALPIGLAAAALPLRAIGWLSVDDALDAFAGSGIGRYGVLLVLLPLWAVISASLAHLAIEALTRRRSRAR